MSEHINSIRIAAHLYEKACRHTYCQYWKYSMLCFLYKKRQDYVHQKRLIKELTAGTPNDQFPIYVSATLADDTRS